MMNIPNIPVIVTYATHNADAAAPFLLCVDPPPGDGDGGRLTRYDRGIDMGYRYGISDFNGISIWDMG